MAKGRSIVWLCGRAALGLMAMATIGGCASQAIKETESAASTTAPAANASDSEVEMNTQAHCRVSTARFHALRLLPADDLRKKLTDYVQSHRIQAAAIVSAVGSLQEASLRMADQQGPTSLTGRYEIVSLSGTLSPDGPHLHIVLSDCDGRTIGGHVLGGCIVYTTAEVVVAELTDLRFSREPDPRTGYRELRIGPVGDSEP